MCSIRPHAMVSSGLSEIAHNEPTRLSMIICNGLTRPSMVAHHGSTRPGMVVHDDQLGKER